MHIISFAWTTKALLDGTKTVTRRCWSDNYAKRFRKGDIVQAYDKSPRVGGKRVALIRLLKTPYRQDVSELTEEDVLKEGALWASLLDFAMALSCKKPYVVEFEVLSKEKS